MPPPPPAPPQHSNRPNVQQHPHAGSLTLVPPSNGAPPMPPPPPEDPDRSWIPALEVPSENEVRRALKSARNLPKNDLFTKQRCELTPQEGERLVKHLKLGKDSARHTALFLRATMQGFDTAALASDLGIGRNSDSDTTRVLMSPPFAVGPIFAKLRQRAAPHVTDIYKDIPPSWNISRRMLIYVRVRYRRAGHSTNTETRGMVPIVTDLRGTPLLIPDRVCTSAANCWTVLKEHPDFQAVAGTELSEYIVAPAPFDGIDARFLCPAVDTQSMERRKQNELLQRLREPAEALRKFIEEQRMLSSSKRPMDDASVVAVVRILAVCFSASRP